MSLQAACASQLSSPETRGTAFGLVLAAGSLTYDDLFHSPPKRILTLLQRAFRILDQRTVNSSRMARTVHVRRSDSGSRGATHLLLPIATK
jgi:hypothetical protein